MTGPGWPDRSGWYAIALFVQTCGIVVLMAMFPELRSDEFFKSIATAIVVTGWIGFAVGQRSNEKERETTAKAVDLANRAMPNQPEETKK